MGELLFFLSHYFVMGLLTLVSCLMGARLLWRFRFNSRLEQICFSLALGLGVLAYLTFFLALVGLLYRSVAVVTLLIAVAFCYPIWIQWPRKFSLLGQQIRDAMKNRRMLVIGLVT